MISPPRELRASLPAELRGMRRDGARLCVVERESGRITHTSVAHLGEYLASGDLLVVNSSRTLPAALRVDRDGAGAGAAPTWCAPRQRMGRAGGADRAAASQRPARTRRDARAAPTASGSASWRRAPTPRCCGGWLSRAATRCARAHVRRADPVLVRARPGSPRALSDRLCGCSQARWRRLQPAVT